ncbi:DNA-directed RNA polymerase II chain RPB9 [Fusarium napiforme]|uniref:DNA-directed RNA polymerase II subunit RPB9 n=2 Tax=Fusarium fujikuroi species complex TaxID=171627 RepID=A0A8H5MS64_9HYPO|nr:DNA-directed RNA polymerase II chain RPB9 [Fusarium napiforme]KAF5599447.1 DNA-directed RNA polymerase II chain RPB9 [Fusarium pseudoanthophilum]KAF5965031.1 DNA-directed RNA polymerase II chain RPB9 [Fusarium coicis]
MATPQSTTSYEGAEGDKKLEQITFRFCSECSNMLYPKEDEDAHKLQFTCRTCQYTEDAKSTCVFRNVLNTSAGETAGVTQDVGSDPTVSHLPPVLCYGCGGVILCTSCGQPDCQMVVSNEKVSQPITGMCQFTLPWEDPFADYDEEMMDEDYDDTRTESDDFLSDASEEFLEEISMCCDSSMNCQHTEAVFFQSQQRSAETGMKLFYVCCECGHIFT